MVWRKFGAKTLQDAFKTAPRGSQDEPGRPKTEFAFLGGGNLEPCWPPFSAQDGPRTLQDASKRPCWGCLGASWERLRASWRSRADKSVPWSRLGLILGGFWEVFDRFLADVHWFFGRCLIDFSIILLWIFDWLLAGFVVLYTVLYTVMYTVPHTVLYMVLLYTVIQCCI